MGTVLRLATAGSVDDGKSTLVGRLLLDSKAVLADQLEHVQRVSAARGLTQTDLALLTDGLRAEREQGITIDVAYRYFATAARDFVLADCPGHVQYTRNTVTGASTADAVVLLVDARHGVVEQTRRHLAVAGLLRVPHVALAVNKMDLVEFDEAVFRRIGNEVAALAGRLGLADVVTFPLCALDGDNVVTRSTRTPSHDGPSLLEWLEGIPVGEDPQRSAFRFPVQYVIRPQNSEYRDYRGYAGRVESGVVRVGDDVVVLPDGRRSRVAGIDTADGPLDAAAEGRSITLLLADDLDVSRGNLIAGALAAPAPSQDLEGTVCWLAAQPLRARARVLVKHGTRTVTALVQAMNGVLDLDTLQVVPATSLGLNDMGRVRLRLAQPVASDDYLEHRRTGSFLIVDAQDGRTLAAGMSGPTAWAAQPGVAAAGDELGSAAAPGAHGTTTSLGGAATTADRGPIQSTIQSPVEARRRAGALVDIGV